MKIEGLAELEKKLIAIEDKTLSKKVMRGAFMKALQPIWKEARRLAPVDTGELRKSIRRRVSITGKKLEGGIWLNTRRGGAGWKANFFEGFKSRPGSRPHIIKPKVNGGKRALAADGKILGSVARHPGNRGRPFLRPAWDTKIEEAVRNFRDTLKQKIDEVAKNGK